jgi:hypothetical protein
MPAGAVRGERLARVERVLEAVPRLGDPPGADGPVAAARMHESACFCAAFSGGAVPASMLFR